MDTSLPEHQGAIWQGAIYVIVCFFAMHLCLRLCLHLCLPWTTHCPVSCLLHACSPDCLPYIYLLCCASSLLSLLYFLYILLYFLNHLFLSCIWIENNLRDSPSGDLGELWRHSGKSSTPWGLFTQRGARLRYNWCIELWLLVPSTFLDLHLIHQMLM